MAWKIELFQTASKQLPKLDQRIALKILRFLRERIATPEDPRRVGAPLKKDLSGFWKHRIGAFRIIAEIQDAKIVVLVLRIGHRSRVYGGH